MSKFWNPWRTARPRRDTAATAPTTLRSRCDDEELAAFLDGRLERDARSNVIARLTEAEDEYEVFARTAIVMSHGDALLARMQTPEARAAARRAFDASTDELRQAAIEAARSSEG